MEKVEKELAELRKKLQKLVDDKNAQQTLNDNISAAVISHVCRKVNKIIHFDVFHFVN